MKTPKEWFEEELSGEPLTQESVIEVLDKGDNKKVSDLSELKKLWNTITK